MTRRDYLLKTGMGFGGLALSAILTLLLIPPMLSRFMSRQQASKVPGKADGEIATAPAE